MRKTKNKNPKAQINVDYVAKLANLTLTASEKVLFQKQLEEILSYVSQLSEVDTRKGEPIHNITGLENVTRQDIPAPSISQEDAISQAPKTHHGFIAVEAIFEDNA